MQIKTYKVYYYDKDNNVIDETLIDDAPIIEMRELAESLRIEFELPEDTTYEIVFDGFEEV